MIEYFSRREFIGKSALIAGGALGSLAIGGNMVSAETKPVNRIEFLETRCHENKQKARILVTYASRCGSTGGVAGAIAGTFCDKGASVDVLRLENVSDLNRYHGIVIGSAIRSDHWLPEAVDFVKQHRNTLSRVPVAYFLTCLALTKNTSENRKIALGYMEPLCQKTSDIIPLDIGLFAGSLSYDKLPFMVRIVMKMKMQSRGVNEGDYRDFKSIRNWAKGIAPALINQRDSAFDRAS